MNIEPATVMAPANQGAAEAKRLANLAARAALAGHQCSKGPDGSITFARWNHSVTFGDLAAAEVWLDRVLGRRS